MSILFPCISQNFYTHTQMLNMDKQIYFLTKHCMASLKVSWGPKNDCYILQVLPREYFCVILISLLTFTKRSNKTVEIF